MSLVKYFTLFIALFFLISCSTPEETEKKETIPTKKVIPATIIPNKITFLFVTQPNCPSCDKLEKVMHLERPKELLENYFEIKKVNLGEELPEGLIPPNGTPTVYFLGANDEVLVEPLVGEKNEAGLMEFLEDALYEFKITYGVEIQTLQ